jgi:hypothetical protein
MGDQFGSLYLSWGKSPGRARRRDFRGSGYDGRFSRSKLVVQVTSAKTPCFSKRWGAAAGISETAGPDTHPGETLSSIICCMVAGPTGANPEPHDAFVETYLELLDAVAGPRSLSRLSRRVDVA